MLGYVGINAAITNNGMEASWNQMKIATRPIGYVLHVHEFLQALFWHISDKTNSRAMEIADDPIAEPFRSSPRPSPNQWHTLQLWKPYALETITIVEGSKDRWRDFVDEVQKERGLSDRLHSVITRLHATGRIRLTARDLRKVYIPDMKFLTSLSARHKQASLVVSIQQMGVQYAQLIRDPQNCMRLYDDVKEMLDVTDSHHEVTYLGDRPWSSVQLYKCTCPVCHKYGVCDHSLLISMIVQATVTIPPQYITTAITTRRRRGRPAPETVSEPRRKLDFEVVTCVDDRRPVESVESNAGMEGEEMEEGDIGDEELSQVILSCVLHVVFPDYTLFSGS